jgi:tripartite-type tricarboxylate transporter receptor subunit TctC
MLKSRFSFKAAAVLAGLAATIAFASAAQAEAVSFAGKKIDLYIGSAPGGGTDLSSRLIGEFLGRYLPGRPIVVYRNIPGAQGIKALNYFATQVKPDGLSLAGGSQGHFDQAGRSLQGIDYDPLTFKYIGGINRGGTVFVIRNEAVGRLGKPSEKPVIVPAVAGASTGPQMALWGKEYLGWNVKFVVGYKGTQEMVLAALSGEADCMASSSSSQLKPLLDDPQFTAYTQLGDLDDTGKFVPKTAFKNTKVFADMIMPKLSKSEAEILVAWLQTQYIDKWFALPAGTPEAVVQTYKAAFDQAVQDPEFIKAAKVQFGEDFTTTSADNMTALVNGMVKNSERVDKHLKFLREKNGLPAE